MVFQPFVFRILIAAAFVAAAIVFVWQAGNYYLVAPPGVFMYLPLATACAFLGFFVATLVLVWKRPLPSGMSKASHFGALAAVIVTCTIVCVFGVPFLASGVEFLVFHADPIGKGDDVSRGPCTSKDLDFPNRRGLVASVRETYCSGFWDGDQMYFVFVHPTSVANAKSNLVLRYVGDTLPETTLPQVKWLSTRNLQIASGTNHLSSERDYKRFEILGASIVYR